MYLRLQGHKPGRIGPGIIPGHGHPLLVARCQEGWFLEFKVRILARQMSCVCVLDTMCRTEGHSPRSILCGSSKSGDGYLWFGCELRPPGPTVCSQGGLEGKKSSVHSAKRHLSTCCLPASKVWCGQFAKKRTAQVVNI